MMSMIKLTTNVYLNNYQLIRFSALSDNYKKLQIELATIFLI